MRKMQQGASKFYFLLHGQTDWDVNDQVIGKNDIPLNAHGIAQTDRNAKFLAQEGISTIYTSPMLRTRHTASIIQSQTGAILIQTEKLDEVDVGEGAGRNNSKRGDVIASWINDGDISLFGSEAKEPFFERVFSILDVARSKYPENLLIVGHRSIYHAICKYLNISSYPIVSHGDVVLFTLKTNQEWSYVIFNANLMLSFSNDQRSDFDE